VLFMFQPGEEGWHGARYMLEDGLLDPLPQAAFALHITPNVPTGVLTGRAGSLMAASDRFVVQVTGRGGHASQPQEAVDPVPIACEIVTAIQAMVTRRISAFDPVVLTVARITAGTADNVIPETAELEGTIRSFSESSRALARDGLKRLASTIAAAHLAQATVDIVPGFPLTVCDAGATGLARAVAEDLFGPAAWQPMAHPMMSAEDFSYVLQKVPGVMVFLGATPDGGDWRTCCPLHSNRIVLDEGVMARGVAMHCAFAERFLLSGFDVASP
jgi:amidohydrolase